MAWPVDSQLAAQFSIGGPVVHTLKMVQPNYRHWPQNRLPSLTSGQLAPALPLPLSLCTASLFGLGSARVGSCAVLPGTPA